MALYLGGKIDVGTNERPPKEATQMSRVVKYIGMDVHKEAMVIVDARLQMLEEQIRWGARRAGTEDRCS